MKITRDSWIYAQQCVLGSCLIDQRAISEILFTLKDTDFVDYYKPIFQTMVDLYVHGKPVDPAVIIHSIGDEYRKTVLELMEITPTAANIRSYAKITAEQSKVLHMRETGLRLTEVDSIEEAVRDADIVSASTSTPTGDPNLYPYIKEEWIKPGALISSTAALRFDDDFIIHRARTVTDNIKLYEAWEEEMKPNAYNTVPIPAVHVMDFIAAGKMQPEQVDDLGDILMNRIPLHRKEDEIIIYSIGGMPVEDVAWGTMVYRNALKKGIGTKLKLWDTPQMV